jgi:hypothetical protein
MNVVLITVTKPSGFGGIDFFRCSLWKSASDVFNSFGNIRTGSGTWTGLL